MALYNLWIPSCSILQIRSPEVDTLVASMGLRVMNAEGGLHHDWPALSMMLGNHAAGGEVPINQGYVNVDVPDPTPESSDGGAIYWSFILTNSGQADNSIFINALNNAANAVSGALVGSAISTSTASATGGAVAGGASLAEGANITGLVAAGAVIGTQALVQLLNAGCDGVVAALGFNVTAAELATMTEKSSNQPNSVQCQGTNSPVGCGANSDYNVSYLISKIQFLTVPNLYKQPLKDAISIAQGLGFSIEETTDIVDGNVDVPTVFSQKPDSGTLVPPGTAIQVTIANPPGANHSSNGPGPQHKPKFPL